MTTSQWHYRDALVGISHLGRRGFWCIGIVLGLALSVLASATALAAPIQGPAAQPKEICVGDPIPDGWVVTGRGYAPTGCNHDDHAVIPILQPIAQPIINLGLNAFTIEPAPQSIGDTVKICPDSPLPSGMVIIRMWAFTPECAGQARTITPITGASMTICANSPLPDGYQKTETTYSLACGPIGQNTFTIAPIRGGGADFSSR